MAAKKEVKPQIVESNVAQNDNVGVITKEKKHPRDLTGGMLLIVIGVILILNNVGVLDWSIWLDVLRFWPVFIVLLGVNIMLGKSWIAQITSFLLLLCVFTLIITYSLVKSNDGIYNYLNEKFGNYYTSKLLTWIKEEDTNSDYIEETIYIESEEGIKIRNIDLELGAGKYIIQDTSIMDREVTSSMEIYAKYFENVGKPVIEETQAGDEKTIEFYTESEDFTSIFDWDNWGQLEYSFLVSDQSIPTSFDINMGSGSNIIDLWYQNVKNIKLAQGSGKTTISLSKEVIPSEKMSIELGSGSIDIVLRDNIAYEIDYEIGSGSVNVDGESLHGVGTYQSSNYSDSDYRFVITLEMGSGSINIVSDQ